MVNINNKPWDKLRFRDIEKFLSESGDENFFFEFKSDDEEPKKLIKEISAFANIFFWALMMIRLSEVVKNGQSKEFTLRFMTVLRRFQTLMSKNSHQRESIFLL